MRRSDGRVPPRSSRVRRTPDAAVDNVEVCFTAVAVEQLVRLFGADADHAAAQVKTLILLEENPPSVRRRGLRKVRPTWATKEDGTRILTIKKGGPPIYSVKVRRIPGTRSGDLTVEVTAVWSGGPNRRRRHLSG